MLRNHGINNDSGKIEFELAGLNYRMTDFQAVLLYSQFLRLNRILEYKNKLSKLYYQYLCENKNITLPSVPNDKKHTWQTYHIMLNNELNRDTLISLLKNTTVRLK